MDAGKRCPSVRRGWLSFRRHQHFYQHHRAQAGGRSLAPAFHRLLQLQDEERRRLGRELHDSLAQSVLAVNLNLAQAAQSSASLSERGRHALAEARRVLVEMSREIRTLSYLLHPPLLDELGLVSALKEYAGDQTQLIKQRWV